MKHFLTIITLFSLLTTLQPLLERLHGATADSINRHGIILGKKKMYKEAIKEFDRAIDKYNKSSAEAYHNRAWTHELMGDKKKAIKNYEEALRRYPKLILSGEKLGYLYYKSKDYINAVRVGEQVLKFDPENKSVKEWLPDAYIKRLKQQQEKLAAEKKRAAEEKKRKEEELRKEQEKRIKEKQILYASYDIMIRNGWYFRGDKGYNYESDPGILLNLPNRLFVQFTPLPIWDFRFILENPFLGAVTPNVTTSSERLEVLYSLGGFKLGVGFMFNHYKGDFAYQAQGLGQKIMWDYKTGILFGYKKKKAEMKFSLYPRLLPYDGSSQSKVTYDTAYYRMDYVYNVSSDLRYYSLISARDYYFFYHTPEISDYWGVYEIGLGVSLGKMTRDPKKVNIAFSLELKQVVYLLDLNNDNPYTRKPNGQSYVGFNSKKWLKGDPMSGYYASSQHFTLRVDERIHKYAFLYQKLLIEMADPDTDHHEFNLVIGGGVVF
jgi:tetratricopeptide (TPR) repeat protein